MKITKFEHACFVVEDQDNSLIVDPGGYTPHLIIPENVACVIVTHEHADHLNPETLQEIYAKNSSTVIVAHQTVVDKIQAVNSSLPCTAVKAGDRQRILSFTIDFFGGEHAVIHQDIPRVANLGIMINDALFYPGDSFVEPQKPVKVLALPISAPWLKIAETIDYMRSVQPEIAFPTHDAILSSTGQALYDNMLLSFAEKSKTTYKRINQAPLTVS